MKNSREQRYSVYDNRSTDNTADGARDAGAVVRRQCAEIVTVAVFSDVDADIYIMADGDGTYDSSVAAKMVSALVDEHLDMVVGTRRNVLTCTPHRSRC